MSISGNKKEVRKILAVRNDRFGEFLLNIPALRALKESFPGSRLTLVVNPNVRELAECIDFVDKVITWENKKHKILEVLKFSKELKNEKFDLCVILNPSKEFNIISFLSGIPVRLGYSRKWGFLLSHKIKDKKYLGEKHEVEYNLDLVKLVDASTNNLSLSLKIDEGCLKGLFELGGTDNLIVIHPWTSDPVKEWPLENFCALTKEILSLDKVKVLLIGGKEELNKNASVFKGLGANLINLTGRTSLKQLAAVLNKAKLLISGDSGPVHLSCAVGTPTLALFRNDLVGKTAKRWGPWGDKHAVIERSNLFEITVGEVFNKAKEMLKI